MQRTEDLTLFLTIVIFQSLGGLSVSNIEYPVFICSSSLGVPMKRTLYTGRTTVSCNICTTSAVQ